MAGFFGGVLGSGFPICALPPSFVSAGGGGSSVRSGIGASVQGEPQAREQRPGGPAGVRDDVLPLERERPRREIERDALEREALSRHGAELQAGRQVRHDGVVGAAREAEVGREGDRESGQRHVPGRVDRAGHRARAHDQKAVGPEAGVELRAARPEPGAPGVALHGERPARRVELDRHGEAVRDRNRKWEVQVVGRDCARDRARPFARPNRAGEEHERDRQREPGAPHARLRDSLNTFRLATRFRLRTKLAPLTSKATVRSRLLGSPASGSSAARSRCRPLAVKR